VGWGLARGAILKIRCGEMAGHPAAIVLVLVSAWRRNSGVLTYEGYRGAKGSVLLQGQQVLRPATLQKFCLALQYHGDGIMIDFKRPRPPFEIFLPQMGYQAPSDGGTANRSGWPLLSFSVTQQGALATQPWENGAPPAENLRGGYWSIRRHANRRTFAGCEGEHMRNSIFASGTEALTHTPREEGRPRKPGEREREENGKFRRPDFPSWRLSCSRETFRERKTARRDSACSDRPGKRCWYGRTTCP